jgi:anti-sigma B factor antagonist
MAVPRYNVPPSPQGAAVPLSLNTRSLGDVTIISCHGRIVAGAENESLRDQVRGLLPDRRDVVLDLGGVGFIDSSGLGTLVRLLTSLRRAQGDLKLCNLPQDVRKLLKLTNLISLFDTHACEEDAISAFYRRTTTGRLQDSSGPTVLCVEQSSDVLAYLRELLRRAGYNVLTSNSMRDGLILMRAARPGLLIVGSSLAASPGIHESFHAVAATLPVIELGEGFFTADAGEAGTDLLERIRARLQPRPGVAS